MARIKQVPGGHAFYCMACKSLHVLDLRYSYNYNADRPTFKVIHRDRAGTQKSLEIHFVVSGFGPGHVHHGKTLNCKFRLIDGVITYLKTSTHDMAGKEMGLIDFDEIAAMQRAAAEVRAAAPVNVD